MPMALVLHADNTSIRRPRACPRSADRTRRQPARRGVMCACSWRPTGTLGDAFVAEGRRPSGEGRCRRTYAGSWALRWLLLEAAYRDLDLGLLGSLLHPQVHWTGVCSNSAQVIDWYRGVLADGTMPTVQSAEVDRDAVLLGLALTRQAEGARPAPPQQLYQVFTVDGAQVIDIRGYPDRHSALTRT